MPVPISPNSYYMHDGGSQGTNSGWHNIDVSSLLNNVHTIQDSILPETRRPPALNKLASDQDANLLMDVWNKSSIIANGSNIEDKTYQPCDVDPMSLNRLETAGLITNHGNKIRFTNRAASIIKTIVLSETNQFLKRSVKKPYSMILAENNNSKKKTLTLTSKVASFNPQSSHQPQAFNIKKCAERADGKITLEMVDDPDCDPEILRYVILRSKDGIAVTTAAYNKNAPPEALEAILTSDRDDKMAEAALKNPNAPPQAVLKWKMKHGKIDREDPAIHDIDYGDQPVDEDWEQLKKMVEGQSFNLKRFAEREITLSIVKDPNCNPEILRELILSERIVGVAEYAAMHKNAPPDALAQVIMSGRKDGVARYAAMNENAPPDTLAQVLMSGRKDGVARYAARNKNAPPDALSQVILSGRTDLVAENAARNKNTPPDTLEAILTSDRDDEVAEAASKNPNAPPQAKIIFYLNQQEPISVEDLTNAIADDLPTDILHDIKEVIVQNASRIEGDVKKIYTKIACHPNAPVDWAVNFFTNQIANDKYITLKEADAIARQIQNPQVREAFINKLPSRLYTPDVKHDDDVDMYEEYLKEVQNKKQAGMTSGGMFNLKKYNRS